jgi:hypothetical protein
VPAFGSARCPLVSTPLTFGVPAGADARTGASSTFHHLGLESILHRAQLRSDLGIVGSVGSSLMGKPALEVRPRAEVGVCAVTAEARRLTVVGIGCEIVRVDWSTRLALRAVPVSVRSACLNSRANSCRATISEPSTSSVMGCTGVFGVCSLHQMAAIMVPVSPLSVTVGTASLRVALTGVISKAKV